MLRCARHDRATHLKSPKTHPTHHMEETSSVTKYTWEDMPKEQLSDQLSRRLITGNDMMLAHVYLKKGCIVPLHHHINEQITYILEGALRFHIGSEDGEEVIV